MSVRGCLRIVFFGVVIFFLCQSIAQAVDDGFSAVKKIPGKYFTLYYGPGVDEIELLGILDIGPEDKILTGESAEIESLPSEQLIDRLDTLFLRVCDILDMRLYKEFKGEIKICGEQAQLTKIYANLFGNELKGRQSFYVHELKTIYATPENFRAGLLGHEIAHAVMNSYFVVTPPVKVQEILAGYVEYQLRK